MNTCNLIAIDLGASSGRVMLATFCAENSALNLKELARFPNKIKRVNESDTWDLEAIEAIIKQTLEDISGQGIQISGIGIDSWGVDFVLLGENGQSVGLPVSYRDARVNGVMEKTQKALGKDFIFTRSGIQFLPFNTLYQLCALREQSPDLIAKTQRLLMIPDYFSYRLTGKMNWEYTNASTTQLLNLTTQNWDEELLSFAEIPPSWFEKPSLPGALIGQWKNKQGDKIPVFSVASHDTASAVLGAPLGDNDAFLCSGTWSLMGFESEKAFINESALATNLTNEAGFSDGLKNNFRVLKNIMGLWLVQRVMHELNITDAAQFAKAGEQEMAQRFLFNANDVRFINPPNMCAEIKAACRENMSAIPETPTELARAIFDNLGALYAQILAELTKVRGAPFSHLHIVGGGSQNHFLNQLTANLCNLPVLSGPIEASVLGNIGAQLIALKQVKNVAHFREIVAKNFPQQHFYPK